MPSSVGRIWGLKHPGGFNYGMQVVTALVLPLQGFWNCVIYIATSLPACKALFKHIVARTREISGSVRVPGTRKERRQSVRMGTP